jgi:tripeptide aminopeptidase
MSTSDSPQIDESLIALFTELVLVPGTSKNERLVADFIKGKLRNLPFTVQEDGSGTAIGGNTGNLIITPDHFDPALPARIFMAHMDTVRRTDGIRVIREHGKITSDGSSQLGADNRAGLAVLLHKLMKSGGGKLNYMVIFTIAEEIGLVGASHLDLSPYNVEAAFVFDSSRRPGAYIRECAGKYQFDITVKGRAAHSAVAPSEGISAIMVAARGLSGIRTGQIDPMTTINIGFVEGGEAMNIVAPKCVVRGEVRSTTYEAIEGHLDTIEEAFRVAADRAGASVVMQRHKDFAPYSLPGDSVAVTEVERAILAAGLQVDPLRYTGGSDANVLNDKGYHAVNIGIGAQKPHADDEFILEEDLMAASRIAKALFE